MTTPIYYYSAEDSRLTTRLRGGLKDIYLGLMAYRLWAYLGWRDFLASTHRTVLGSVWVIVTYLFKVVSLGYIYSRVLNDDLEKMLAYIAAGLALWDFISTILGGGVSVFLSQATLIKERADPLSSIALRNLVKTFLQFGYRLAGFAIVVALLGMPLRWAHLLVVPGLMVYMVAAFPLLLALGSLGARFRDLGEVAQPLTLLLFLVSPVLWHSGHLGNASWVSEFNPVAHFLEIVRAPMMGQVPSSLSAGWVLASIILAWGAGLIVFSRVRNRVVFWV